MATQEDSSFAAQAFLLQTRGRTRCRNLILHPKGRLFGDVMGLACPSWCLQDDRIYFVNHRGKVRFVFERAADGNWKYTAPVRPSALEPVGRYTMILEGRGPVTVATSRFDYQLLPQNMPTNKRAFEIVVAKYKEDMAWADAVSANATIYSKDVADQGRYPTLANLGREGGTYFHHIMTRYDELAERTLFLQGDPFCHPLLAFSDYVTDSAPFLCAACERSSIETPIPWSAPAQCIDRAAMMDFLRLVECDPAMTDFLWVQGAQFAVSREQIRRRTLDYYRRMYGVTQQEKTMLAGRTFDNHHVAWLFELFWRYIFSAGNENADVKRCSRAPR